MLHHNGLFSSVISDPSDCMSIEEMEEIIYVNNAIDDFEVVNGILLTKTERKAIMAGASCGEGFEEKTAKMLLEKRFNVEITNAYITDRKILYLERNIQIDFINL